MSQPPPPHPIPEHEVLRLRVEPGTGDIAVLVADGEIDLYTAARFRAETTTLLEHHQHVVLDLSAVRFLGSAGMQAIAELHNRPTGSLHIAGASRTMHRAFQVAGMDRFLSLYIDVRHALDALG